MKHAILLLLVLALFKGCGEDKNINQGLDAIGIPSSHAEFKHEYTTPFGVKVRSTVKVPPQALDAIDRGILEQLDRINRAKPEWTNRQSPSQYAVLFVDPMATNVETEPGSPAILIKGVQSAGTVIGWNGDAGMKRSYIVAPHQDATQWRYLDYLKRTIWYESEHDRECNEPNERQPSDECRYYQTVNDVHPHFE